METALSLNTLEIYTCKNAIYVKIAIYVVMVAD